MILRLRKNASVTAGLMWQPETWPIVYAIASSARPKARATPSVAHRVGGEDRAARPDDHQHARADGLGGEDLEVRRTGRGDRSIGSAGVVGAGS